MKAFIEQRADPYIIRKDGWYYFTASAPEFDRIVLRKARTLKELPDAVEKIVWTKHPEGPMSCNIWAPELHFVDGRWYIYFAAARGGADESGVYDHRIYALEYFPEQLSRQTRDTGRITCWGGREGSWIRFRSRSMAVQASSIRCGSMVQMGLGKLI